MFEGIKGMKLIKKITAVIMCIAMVSLTQVNGACAMENTVGSETVLTEQVQTAEYVSIPEEEVPLGTMSKRSGVSWWWIMTMVFAGAVGAEVLSRKKIKDRRSISLASLAEIKRS